MTTLKGEERDGCKSKDGGTVIAEYLASITTTRPDPSTYWPLENLKD